MPPSEPVSERRGAVAQTCAEERKGFGVRGRADAAKAPRVPKYLELK
jgi:hypothetical protein